MLIQPLARPIIKPMVRPMSHMYSSSADIRTIAKGGGVAESVFANPSNYTRAERRTNLVMPAQPVDNIRIAFFNGYAFNGFVNAPNPVTIEVGLERVSPAQTVLFTWGGSTTKTFAAGEYAVSDPIPASAFSLSQFPVNELFYSRFGCTVNSGEKWVQNSTGAPMHNAGVVGFTATSSSQIGNTGNLVTPTGGAAFFHAVIPFPLMILGEWKSAKLPSILLFGDSLMAQLNDVSDAGSGVGGGFGVRGSYNAGATKQLPIIRAGRGGEQATSWANPPTVLREMMKYSTHLFCNLGINDITAGRTHTQLIADNQAINAAFKQYAKGAKYTMFTKCSPRTNVANTAPYGANNGVGGPFDTGGARDLYNANIASIGADAIFDINTYVQDAVDPRLMVAGGSTDGVHWSSTLHGNAGNALSTIWSGWTTT